MVNLLAKYKLRKEIIKKYEPKLGLYFFYNARKDNFWNTDEAIGSVIAALDGTLTYEEIINIISENNKHIEKVQIESILRKSFDFLIKEEYLCE